jgi:hypothetical protein
MFTTDDGQPSQTQNACAIIALVAREKSEIAEFQMLLPSSNTKRRCPDSTVLALSFD